MAVELYTLTKSFSMAGRRVAFLVGNAEVVQALTKLKSYLDYGTFQPIQIAATVAMNEAQDYPKIVNEIYQHRRDALCEGLHRIGWEVQKPKGTMFVWAPIPEPYKEMRSLEFAKFLVAEAKVATAPEYRFRAGGGRLRSFCARGERAAHRPRDTDAAQGAGQALKHPVRWIAGSLAYEKNLVQNIIDLRNYRDVTCLIW